MPDLDADAIATAALEPKKVETDGQVAEAHSLKDLVEAAKVTAASASPRSAWKRAVGAIGLPPGANGRA